MSDLGDLYQQLILDHNAKPRNFGTVVPASHHADGVNPLCGDHVTVTVRVENNTIVDVKFSGNGCAISKASASLMTEFVKGKSLEIFQHTFSQFHTLVATEQADTVDVQALGKLAAFSGVREFPMRVKCATLAWHTLRAALEQQAEPVSTEAP